MTSHCAENPEPTRTLPAALDSPAAWGWVARQIQHFAECSGSAPRDLIVLLPFAQHLPLARAAWAAMGDALWLPRFETTRTLAAGLVGSAAVPAGALAFDAVADGLQAGQMLSAAAPAWAASDPGGFELAVARVVETALALARARLALPAPQRAAWLEEARGRLSPRTGLDAQERALARLALEWSITADASAADALQALAPGGWVALRAGPVDPLTAGLLARAAAPVLWLDAAVPLEAPREGAAVCLAECSDFEDEAQRTAAQVLVHLSRGEQPVALIALDRVLVRRVRALLERQQVQISDETGWKLSTTRAGACIAGLLRAAGPRASTDELLDWLKSSGTRWHGLDPLESAWRRSGISALRRVVADVLEPPAAALWQEWLALAEPLQSTRRLSLSEWLQRLQTALQRAGLWQALRDDAAGAQVLDALGCGEGLAVWSRQAAQAGFDAAGFRRWVESVLEEVAFQPDPPSADWAADVVVTPLARAMLRPFAAVVCAGADEARLGVAPAPQPLLDEATAVALGLPGGPARREAEEVAFAQLLRVPRLTLLHRRLDGSEPLQPSALLLRLRFAAQRAGRPLDLAPDLRESRAVAARPVPRPAPSAPALLPGTLSASAYEALRACPYRFFARSMLRLGEDEELDDAFEKRDYGTWLHAVLQDFHARRDGSEPAGDAVLLRSVARERQDGLNREDADFLPYASWFEQFVPRYLALLHREEAGGLRVHETERELQARPAALEGVGVGLRGRIDRIDRLGDGTTLRIVDYKTSGEAALRDRLREPLEDTQLPFYAALLAAAGTEPPGAIEAVYLALDGREGVALLPHAGVEESAAALLAGIAADYARLRAGAALPALGEGKACEHCTARGLCRRDHWDEAAAAAGEAP